MKEIEGKIGEILIAHGLITEEELQRALEIQARTNVLIGTVLLRCTKLKEEDLLKALSKQFNLPFVTLKDKYIDWALVTKFSASLVLDNKCFPISQDDASVTMAVNNPLDVWGVKRAEEEAGTLGGLKVKLVLVSKADLEEVIDRYKIYIREGKK